MEDIFFLKGLNDLLNKSINLPITYAKVIEVYENGYLVDVELILKNEGLETYKNIPVLKNRYFNTPILKDDIVILLVLSHLQDDYLNTGDLENPIELQSYVALPYVLKKDFENQKFTNDFYATTPQGKIKVSMIDTDLKLEGKESNLLLDFKKININSKEKISLKTSEQLGKVLIDFINILTSAKTELGGGGDAPHIHKSIDSSSVASLNNISKRLGEILETD